MTIDMKPLTLASPPTGEHFEFLESARSNTGRFRFTWTLSPGKRGPGEHVHEHETETFRILRGTIRIWLNGVPADYGPGDVVVVRPRTPHRFLNPGREPVAIDVDLDGTGMEDAFIPVAMHFRGKARPSVGGILRMMVHFGSSRASTPTSKFATFVVRALTGMLRLFRVKGFERVEHWAPQELRAAA